MNEHQLYQIVVWSWIGIAAGVFLLLLFVTAPYGRFARKGWGPVMSNRLGWIIMELPASLFFFAFYLLGDRHLEVVPLVLLVIWQIHYVHRSLIFPWRIKGDRKQTTILTVSLAVVFNFGNTYLNARWLYTLGPHYELSWLYDPRFIAGLLLFALGYGINKHSDHILIKLRKPGETGYKIPRGGMYSYVTCPNYLGEIMEWAGWALMCWHLGALAFLVWTVANLAPRALSNHKWYLGKFEDYPKERKALIPFVI